MKVISLFFFLQLLSCRYNCSAHMSVWPRRATCIQRWISCLRTKTRKRGGVSRRGTYHTGRLGYQKQQKSRKKDMLEKVYFRSHILERSSIGEYWNFFGVPVLPENVIFMFFRTCWCYSEAYNTGTQKWSRIVQYSCTSIRDLKYTFSDMFFWANKSRDKGMFYLL